MSRIVQTAVAWLALSGALFAESSVPTAVSPGARDHAVASATPCPLFSWALAGEAAEYVVVVVAADSGKVVREIRLPRGARAWRPGGGACLERGGTYAWSVRASGDGSDSWAEPLLFAVPARPGEEEIRKAVEVLTAWLEEAEGDAPVSSRASARAPRPRITIAPDVTAVSALFETLSVADVTVGVHGLSHSTTAGSAGAVGEARAMGGNTGGVIGQAASSGSVAGAFDNTGGGVILETRMSGTPLMRINGSGTVFSPFFTGKGTALTGVDDLDCIECVDGSDIVDGTITYLDLGVDSVGQAKIAPDAVGNAELATASVGTAEIATGAITEEKIADGVIGNAPLVSTHFAVGAVTSSKIASGAVDDLDTNAVTRSKLQGSEKRIREIHADCPGAGVMTFDTQCTSKVCETLPTAKFLDCSGNCTETSPAICSNAHTGWLLDPTMDL